jgi:pimeloyl-ACP methyl ester carboxylesterase
MTPVKYAQYMADRIPGSKMVIIAGATHSVALEKPDEVNRAIAGWRRGI